MGKSALHAQLSSSSLHGSASMPGAHVTWSNADIANASRLVHQRWDEGVLVEAMCRQLVESAVDASQADIVRAYADHLAVPWSVQSVVGDMMEALSLLFVDQELLVAEDDAAGTEAEDRFNPFMPLTTGSQQPLFSLVPAAPTASRPSSASMTRVTEGGGAFGDVCITVTQSADKLSGNSSAKVLKAVDDWDLPVLVEEPPAIAADSWCRAAMTQRRKQPAAALSPAPASAATAGVTPALHRHMSRSVRSVNATAGMGSANQATLLLGVADSSHTDTSSVEGSTLAAPDGKAKSGGADKKRSQAAKNVATAAKDGAAGNQAAASTSAPSGSPVDPVNESVQERARQLSAQHARETAAVLSKQLAQLKLNPGQSFIVDGAAVIVVDQTKATGGEGGKAGRGSASNSADAAVPLFGKVEPRLIGSTLADADGSPALRGPTPVTSDERPSTTPASRVQTPAFSGTPPKSRRRGEDGVPSAAFFTPDVVTGPMVSGVQPAGGVFAKEGDRVVRAELKNPKSKMTRQDFAKAFSLQAVQPTSATFALDETVAAVGPPLPSAVSVSATTPPPSSINVTSAKTDAISKAASPSLARTQTPTSSTALFGRAPGRSAVSNAVAQLKGPKGGGITPLQSRPGSRSGQEGTSQGAGTPPPSRRIAHSGLPRPKALTPAFGASANGGAARNAIHVDDLLATDFANFLSNAESV